MKRYYFSIDNIERGLNKKIYITITDSSLKGAKKQIKKVFGEINTILNHFISSKTRKKIKFYAN